MDGERAAAAIGQVDERIKQIQRRPVVNIRWNGVFKAGRFLRFIGKAECRNKATRKIRLPRITKTPEFTDDR